MCAKQFKIGRSTELGRWSSWIAVLEIEEADALTEPSGRASALSDIVVRAPPIKPANAALLRDLARQGGPSCPRALPARHRRAARWHKRHQRLPLSRNMSRWCTDWQKSLACNKHCDVTAESSLAMALASGEPHPYKLWCRKICPSVVSIQGLSASENYRFGQRTSCKHGGDNHAGNGHATALVACRSKMR